jgi:fibronectin-binding autotransporter adhesin
VLRPRLLSAVFVAVLLGLAAGNMQACIPYFYVGQDGDISKSKNWGPPNGLFVSDLDSAIYFNQNSSNLLNLPSFLQAGQLVFDYNGASSASYTSIMGLGTGTSVLELGGYGILVEDYVSTNRAFISGLDIRLVYDQTWSVHSTATSGTPGGILELNASLLASASNLTKEGDGTLKLNLSSSSYTGSVTVNAGHVMVGASNALGTGPLTLHGNTYFEPFQIGSNPTAITLGNSSITLGNNVTFGLPAGNNIYSGAELSILGPITLIDPNTTIQLTGEGTFFLKNALNLPGAGTFTVQGTSATEYGAFIFDDGSSLDPNLINITASGNAAVIFAMGSTGLANTSVDLRAQNYGVIGAGYTGSSDGNANLNWVLSRITNKAAFNGLLSLDAKQGIGANFVGSFDVASDKWRIDLSGFSSTNFRFGTMTSANIPGFDAGSGKAVTIIPPGGAGGLYKFGGGGGRMVLGASLNGSGLDLSSFPEHPMTLVLQGNNTLSNPAYVENSLLILDNSNVFTNTNKTVNLGPSGYLSATPNLGVTPSTFLGTYLGTYVDGAILGFDSAAQASSSVTLTGDLDLSGLISGKKLWLGTTTRALNAGTGISDGLIIPYATTIKPTSDRELRLLALGATDDSGSQAAGMTIKAPLLGANIDNVVYGHSNAVLTFGKNGNSPGEYTIAGNATETNTYTGGTSILGGKFNVSGATPFGTGTVSIEANAGNVSISPGFVRDTGADSLQTASRDNVTFTQSFIANNKSLSLGTFSGGGSLTFNGAISGSTQLIINGSTFLKEVNTYSGGTQINGGANLTVAKNGGLGTGYLNLFNSTLTFEDQALAPVLNNVRAYNANIVLPPTATLLTMNMGMGSNGPSVFNGSIADPGGGTSTAALLINNGGNAAYHFNASSNLTYSGGTTINSGALVLNPMPSVAQPLGASSGTVTLNDAFLILNPQNNPVVPNPILFGTGNNKLAGHGTFLAPGGLVVGPGGILSPGTFTTTKQNVPMLAATDVLTIGSSDHPTTLTLASGGGLDIALFDPAGSPGLGFNAIQVNGDINITATSLSPFSIKIITPGNPFFTNYSNGTMYSMPILSSTGTISGFDPGAFSLDLMGYHVESFVTPTTDWSFTQSGNAILLNFQPVPEPETWVMMVLGSATLLLGAVRRRKQS